MDERFRLAQKGRETFKVLSFPILPGDLLVEWTRPFHSRRWSMKSMIAWWLIFVQIRPLLFQSIVVCFRFDGFTENLLPYRFAVATARRSLFSDRIIRDGLFQLCTPL